MALLSFGLNDDSASFYRHSSRPQSGLGTSTRRSTHFSTPSAMPTLSEPSRECSGFDGSHQPRPGPMRAGLISPSRPNQLTRAEVTISSHHMPNPRKSSSSSGVSSSSSDWPWFEIQRRHPEERWMKANQPFFMAPWTRSSNFRLEGERKKVLSRVPES